MYVRIFFWSAGGRGFERLGVVWESGASCSLVEGRNFGVSGGEGEEVLDTLDRFEWWVAVREMVFFFFWTCLDG